MLAGGSSSRLGKPKQLLPFRGSTLLNHAIGVANKTRAGKVVVVIGAYSEEIIETIQDDELLVIQNDQWNEGMGSSIRAGLEALLKADKNIKGVIIMTCDQPHLTSDHLLKLLESSIVNDKPVAASSYGGSLGIPAFFRKENFSQLLSLEGESGAKQIILDNKDLVQAVEFPSGAIDIDTEADYEKLLNKIEG